MSDVTHFDEVDPFNPQNQVVGELSLTGKAKYGSLLIKEINGKLCEQLIFATPKLNYPFDSEGKFNIPRVDKIEAYTKYDGTNVFAFQYEFGGEKFISYKTRLRPFLAPGKGYSDFYTMWNEMLEKYPDIPQLFQENPDIDGFSFELYGTDNTHLIKYDVPLDCALLFGIRDGGVVAPTDINHMDVPVAELESVIGSDDVVEDYRREQEKMGDEIEEADGIYLGQEGQVWYVFTPNGEVLQWKCKPHVIEQIHWTHAGSAIHKNIIKATAQNALENVEVLTVDYVSQLLAEEFNDELIQLSFNRIHDIVTQINTELALMSSVTIRLDMWSKEVDLKEKNIGDVMRYLIQFYNKSENQRVFFAANNYMKRLNK